MKWFTRGGVAVLCVLGLAACGSGDDGGTSGVTSGGDDTGGAAASAPAEVDLLLVLDNSVSMAAEQAMLRAGVSHLVEALQAAGGDVRVGVITTDVLSASDRGKLRHEAPTAFPQNNMMRVPVKCVEDADCATALAGQVATPETWVCETAAMGVDNMINPNGSLNSACRKTCSVDADCADGYPTGPDLIYACAAPGGDQSLRGCLVTVPIAGCPASLPEIADATTAAGLTVGELAGCLSIVGASQDKNPQLEQGLGAAVLALDPSGPNASQVAAFVRPSAYQVVLFVSDEDDCSMAADMPAKFAKNGTLVSEAWQLCAVLGDTDGKDALGGDIATSAVVPSAWKSDDGRGPLEPVHAIADALRAINPDPSHVLVAALVGGVWVGGPPPVGDPLDALRCAPEAGAACVQEHEEAYLSSLTGTGPLAKNAAICVGAAGSAMWGGRYEALVAAFGDNGVGGNLCGPALIPDTLQSLGGKLAARIATLSAP